VKASLATERMRSRLRWASVRGVRGAGCCFFAGMGSGLCKRFCNRRVSPVIHYSETLSVLLFGAGDVNGEARRRLGRVRQWVEEKLR
jgi:hypothetical protein